MPHSRQRLHLRCLHQQTGRQHTHLSVSSILLCANALSGRQVHKFRCCSAFLCMWLQGVLVPTPQSLHQSAERPKEGGGRKTENRLEHFLGVPSFIIWSARSCWTTNQKCAKERERRQQKTDKSCVFQPPPGKVPSLGEASNFPWPSYSLSHLYLTAGSIVGFINENSDGRASFSITMSSRQIWQV